MIVVSSQGCSVSIARVGVVQGMIVGDAMGRPLRLTVTTEVLGGSALKVHHALFTICTPSFNWLTHVYVANVAAESCVTPHALSCFS